MTSRIDWNALRRPRTGEADHYEPSEPFPLWKKKTGEFGNGCITVLTTQFVFNASSHESVETSVTFDRLGGDCTLHISLSDHPKLRPVWDDTNESLYWTELTRWDMKGWPSPSDATISLVIENES